ncbi:winged helix-turn-helix domain-containing protein [Runella sp. CRIBMP]|uniref:helix-turn-helix domain-containing protein n=1 Tax=Runella sp. CRIBMP TaxID=2683261 RepID=UPI001E287783|nr:winged helix-turn-helix domain-containing protein [Runella sp. CRIBMP]
MEIMVGKLAIVASFLAISLLFGQFAWISPDTDATNSQRFEEKTNLALRRTGHRLLLASGDSTSRIPAVRKLDDDTYVLQLSKSFDYNQLPSLLQESFDLHGIKNNYDVAVMDCKTNELQLGYNFLDYSKSKEVACIGRDQVIDCYNVKITFLATANNPKSNPVWWTLGLGIAFIGVSYVVLSRRKTPLAPLIETPDEKPIENSNRIRFGESSMDLDNQMLYTSHTKHNLTFREAKLLHLFIKHQNQVLERDFILKSVWEDEGVTVGRSIDVFVSRLRKLLQEDTSLKIAAVHGVGYRLEVNNGNPALKKT